MPPLYREFSEAPWVRVEWEDIQDADDWDEEGDEIHCTAQMYSTGFLIYEDRKTIIIARDYSVDEGTWHEKRAFPRGVVLSVRRATNWVDEDPRADTAPEDEEDEVVRSHSGPRVPLL